MGFSEGLLFDFPSRAFEFGVFAVIADLNEILRVVSRLESAVLVFLFGFLLFFKVFRFLTFFFHDFFDEFGLLREFFEEEVVSAEEFLVLREVAFASGEAHSVECLGFGVVFPGVFLAGKAEA